MPPRRLATAAQPIYGRPIRNSSGDGVRPYIEDALGFLQVTQDGKAWIANLYGNVFAAEHGAPGLGRPG